MTRMKYLWMDRKGLVVFCFLSFKSSPLANSSSMGGMASDVTVPSTPHLQCSSGD